MHDADVFDKHPVIKHAYFGTTIPISNAVLRELRCKLLLIITII
jgi:hypothetical protein